MNDAQIAALARGQFNRISRYQLLERGVGDKAIAHRVATGRLTAVEDGVFAVAPVLEDEWGKWMGATLTAPASFLSHRSGSTAWGFLRFPQDVLTITRPGSGGPRRLGGVLVYRSLTLGGHCTELEGVPITSPGRTLLDIAPSVSDRALARAVREAVRLERITIPGLIDTLRDSRGRRGVRRLIATAARYTGLPIQRARSGAEVRALEILRDAGRRLPEINEMIAGAEADLSWQSERLIVEIDGRPFHLDKGEDARKEAAWRTAGWTVRRLPSQDVYEHPDRLLALAPNTERP